MEGYDRLLCVETFVGHLHQKMGSTTTTQPVNHLKDFEILMSSNCSFEQYISFNLAQEIQE